MRCQHSIDSKLVLFADKVLLCKGVPVRGGGCGFGPAAIHPGVAQDKPQGLLHLLFLLSLCLLLLKPPYLLFLVLLLLMIIVLCFRLSLLCAADPGSRADSGFPLALASIRRRLVEGSSVGLGPTACPSFANCCSACSYNGQPCINRIFGMIIEQALAMVYTATCRNSKLCCEPLPKH